jgi:hypothetical protein
MLVGTGGTVIWSALAGRGDETVLATVATPANISPATLKLPTVLNNFDFKFLRNISFSPFKLMLCFI